jgi:hypothetical protein
VQDTADTAQAAGQPDASTTDTAQQPDVQPGGGTQDSSTDRQPQGGDPWEDRDAARKEIEKLRRESAGWRTKYREAEPQLTEYQQWQESQKTEQQKLLDAKEAAEQQLADLRSTNARLMAAATHNIPPDLIDLLGSGTDEEINARAEVLAERLKATAPAPAPTPQRPVEALTPGAATATGGAGATPDEWIRRLAGRTP